MLSWKNRTVTPAGGVSVTVRLTAGFGLLGGVVVTEDWLPHPAINRRNTTVKRNSAALRIFASSGQLITWLRINVCSVFWLISSSIVIVRSYHSANQLRVIGWVGLPHSKTPNLNSIVNEL